MFLPNPFDRSAFNCRRNYPNYLPDLNPLRYPRYLPFSLKTPICFNYRYEGDVFEETKATPYDILAKWIPLYFRLKPFTLINWCSLLHSAHIWNVKNNFINVNTESAVFTGSENYESIKENWKCEVSESMAVLWRHKLKL